jgi:hypothetical protein
VSECVCAGNQPCDAPTDSLTHLSFKFAAKYQLKVFERQGQLESPSVFKPQSVKLVFSIETGCGQIGMSEEPEKL